MENLIISFILLFILVSLYVRYIITNNNNNNNNNNNYNFNYNYLIFGFYIIFIFIFKFLKYILKIQNNKKEILQKQQDQCQQDQSNDYCSIDQIQIHRAQCQQNEGSIQLFQQCHDPVQSFQQCYEPMHTLPQQSTQRFPQIQQNELNVNVNNHQPKQHLQKCDRPIQSSQQIDKPLSSKQQEMKSQKDNSLNNNINIKDFDQSSSKSKTNIQSQQQQQNNNLNNINFSQLQSQQPKKSKQSKQSKQTKQTKKLSTSPKKFNFNNKKRVGKTVFKSYVKSSISKKQNINNSTNFKIDNIKRIVKMVDSIKFNRSKEKKWIVNKILKINKVFSQPKVAQTIDLPSQTMDFEPIESQQFPTLSIKSEMIVEDFKLIKQLGSGGCGSVYLALCNQSHVAIKRSNSISSAKILKNEIEILENINHPNIVKYIGSIIDPSGEFFMVTELLKSEVSDIILSPTKLPLHLRLKMALDIAYGIKEIHSHGIIHRDLKLENLMIDHFNVVKIMDFGISENNDVKSNMSIKGTLAYMAPEIFSNKGFNESIDIYSFGIILYELVSCQRVGDFLYSIPKYLAYEYIKNHQFLPIFKDVEFQDVSLKSLVEICWNPNVQIRPSIDQIIIILNSLYINYLNNSN